MGVHDTHRGEENQLKLVIVPTTGPRMRMLERITPMELGHIEFPSWTDADFEQYGKAWAWSWPTDIVMLVE